ncbi:RNA polymerase sigma factor [Parafrigoribacterium mesophilum]|uniref:RNA polymerase sigma factor n=1 Tax=Parafrigoribacterium mesophilum TaxID=433646 RepID=UPI0031FC3A52
MKPPFEHIVTRYGPAVLRVCRAVVGADDADDAWSETFLSALRAYPALDGGANVEAWLVTIAHRKSIDLLRARKRRPITTDVLPEPPAAQVDAERLDLERAIAALPDKQRHALAYHYLIGLPYGEVAGILGGSPDAARKAASEGIRTLRLTLDSPQRAPMPRPPIPRPLMPRQGQQR